MSSESLDKFILGFLKYHHLEYLKELQKGILYCSPIQTFAELDPVDGRGDKYEYVVKQTFGKSAILDFKNGDFNITHIEGIKIREDYYQYNYYNKDFYANLFCLYGVTTKTTQPVNKIELPENLISMGSHVLIIWDSVGFIERVKSALVKQNLEYQMRLVEYLDLNNYEGSKSFFQKPLRYSYQQEYRIMIKNDRQDVLRLNIGDISDIVTILNASDVMRLKIIRY